jgi:quercetin dioxygenase-like cupin family protein
MTHGTGTPNDRTRTHPEERFAPPAQAFDLAGAAAELAREPSTSSRGHRQKTLYRHGAATLALFLFEAGARMPQHRAAGTVFIQALEGRLTVQAEGRRHELPAGSVLVLAPDVPHDVTAEGPSQMLLTVCLVQTDKQQQQEQGQPPH